MGEATSVNPGTVPAKQAVIRPQGARSFFAGDGYHHAPGSGNTADLRSADGLFLQLELFHVHHG